MEFRILGSLEADSDGMLVRLAGSRERSVIAALALDAGRVVPVPRLVDAVWDDDPPATAGKQIINAVARLRRALGAAGARDLIVTESGGYRLAVDECTVDVRVFEAKVAAASQAASAGKIAEAAGLLRSALALWRGPALAGLTSRCLELTAAALDEQRVAAEEMCCGYELALGRHFDILGELGILAASYPFREKLAGQYMLALYRCGRQADALAAYRALQQSLVSQLGLDPCPELQQLQQQILTRDPALTFQDTGSGAPRPTGSPPLPLPAAAQVRYSLPADTAAFTGRCPEMDRIKAAVGPAGADGAVAIVAIDGMPGVGKSTLAVHAAHVLAREFPDRQLLIDLHAHTPGHEPVRANDALGGLLAAVGVDPRCLPGDLAGRAAMWRDRMAGQRALLVLDNAASSSQVVPLLPGGGGSLVLVTSRRHLGDLPGAVVPVLLDTLRPEDAAQMFTRLAPQAAKDPDGIGELMGLAGFLPLAVSLLGRVFARHPSWTVADLIAETRSGLLTITAEHDSVAAAFEVSYRHLDPDAQQLFRLLGVHPGTVIDSYAAAALAKIERKKAAALLDRLHREGLVTEASYRRYGMHDLIRRYARDLAAADAPAVGSRAALDRVLNYYQHTATLADKRLARQTRPGPVPSDWPGFEVPDLDDVEQALAWVRADRATLFACLDLTTRSGQHARVVALTAGLAAALRHDGPWPEATTRHSAAVDAARHLGDRLDEANALANLGDTRHLKGDYPKAAQALQEALSIYRDLGNQLGEANTLYTLGTFQQLRGDYPEAAETLEEALSIYRDLGDRLGEANALRDLGIVRRLTGDYGSAAQTFAEALSAYRDLGNRMGEATTMTNLGTVRQVTGDYPGATGLLEQALAIFRNLGNRLGQANALYNLGIVRRMTGDYQDAAGILGQALSLYRDLGDRLGQANALGHLGMAQHLTGNHPAAAGTLNQALDIYRDLGSRIGEANVLHRLGIVRRMTGDHPGATRILEQAMAIFRDAGDRQGEAEVLNEQATLHQLDGDLAAARERHQQALRLARMIGSPPDEARALAGLGRCAMTVGHGTQAEKLLRQAYQIYERIGAVEARDVLADLAMVSRSSSA